MTITGITSISFVDIPTGDLQGDADREIGYPILDATNGLIGFSTTPTVDRIEVNSSGGVTGFGATGELAILTSASDFGWTGLT